jgi:quinolinate synthase
MYYDPRTNIDAVAAKLRGILCDDVSDDEIRRKAELAVEIERLKRERNALVLGHNYMEPALYNTVPDVVGDSLELSRRAAEATCDTIVFCGVRFMAETAKILNPTRRVLIPSPEAGCSLASGISADDVRALKRMYPGAPVVAYVNTYAEVKAEVDICCSSANAAAVLASLDAPQVIFIPDEYLTRNVAREAGRTVAIHSREDLGGIPSRAEVIGWQARCEVHERFTVEDILNARANNPGLVTLAHPECSPEVVAASDFSGSTSAMIRYVESTPAPSYLLLTECAMGDNIVAANPDRKVLRLCSMRCPHMGEITLEQTRDALLYDRYAIEIDEGRRRRALRSIERMIAVS